MTAPELNTLACAPRNALATAMGVALQAPARMPADDPAPAPRDTPAIDLAEAGRFLTMLDEATDGFTFQTADDNKGRKNAALAGHPHGSLERLAPTLARLNDAGAAVYVTVNETDGKGRTKENITRVRAVFADFDGAPLAAPDAWGLEPHAIIESSPGKWHVYWFVDGLPLVEFVPIMHAIAARFGSDPNVCDVTRVMRLPGFLHRKGQPFRSRIIHESGALPYTADVIRAVFPPVDTTQAACTAPQAPRVAGAVECAAPETVRDLRSALGSMRADDRALWVRMGQALRGLGDVGRALWVEWSMTSNKWQPTDAKRWDGFGGKHSDYRAVFAEAQRHSWQNPMTAQHDTSAPASSGPALVAVDVADVQHADLPPPRFVVERLIPRRQITLLGGHGGAGKSMLALTIAAHVAGGEPWAGFAVEAGPVVFVTLEDEADVVRWRLRNVLEAYALDAVTVAGNLRVLDGTASDACLAVEQAAPHASKTLAPTGALAELAEAAKGCALIVVDNASDGYAANSNDPMMVRAFMRRMLGRVARDTGAGVLLLAHIDKDAARHGSRGNAYIGTTAWHNSARSRLALLATDGRGLELVHEKTNFGKLADAIPLQRSEHGVLLAVAGDAANPAASLLNKADTDAVMAAMAAADRAGQNVPAGRAGPSTAQHMLATFGELPEYLHGARGRARFWRAVDALVRDGKVCAGSYTNADRKKRQRLEICAGTFA